MLFVDDDPDVLASLRRLLRRDSKHWNIEFALGGRAALILLSQNVFDVVVCDMRMPEMTGADVFRNLTKSHPGTLRILLTGGGDDATLMEAKLVIDHLLHKPCAIEVLRMTVDGKRPAEQASP